MTDLHEAFATWLLRGGREELPRDVALHASTCPECLGGAAAMDALGVVDPGAAELPPLRVVAGRYRRRRGIAPAVTGAAAVLLVVAAGIVAGGLLFNPPRSVGVAVATPTPAEGVLGDQGGPSASATATASPAPTDSLTETAGPSPTPAPTAASLPSAPPEPNPTMGGGPPPPPPSTGPTATPTPRPTPTPPPTPAPTPTPTIPPTPTPSPVLDDCEDNIDNDGDLLIDAADPGCPLDGNEASA